MEKLTAEGLSECLAGHLPPDLIRILKDQGINGTRFMLLTEGTLKLFDFNLCHIIDIMTLIKEIQSGTKDLTLRQLLNSSTESSTTENIVVRRSKKGGTSGQASPGPALRNHSPIRNSSGEKSNDTSENEPPEDEQAEHLDPNLVAADELLRSLVKPSYIKDLSPYELLNVRNHCANWLRATAMGLPVKRIPMGIPESALITGGGSESPSPNPSPPKKKSKNLDQSNSTRKSRRQLVTPIQVRAALADVSNANVASSSKSRPQLRKPVRDEDSNDDDDDDDHDSGTQQISENQMYKLPQVDHFKSSEEILLLQPQLPSFDVEDILVKNEKTQNFVPFLKEGYLFIEKVRKLIFRTVVRHICYNEVDHPTKVTGTIKEGLAKSMLVKFPQFQKLVVVPGQDPWSHITAHFQNIFKRVLNKVPLAERPRKGKIERKKKTKPVRCTINVDSLGILNPDRTHRDEIHDGMRKTFDLRSADRRKGDSITELLVKYPQLKHYQGELLTLEFELMYPQAHDMVRVLTPLIPKVIEKFSEARSLKPKCGLDEMKVFLYLAAQLPHSIDKDASPLPEEPEIVVTLKVGKQHVEEYVEERRSKARSAVQPYLIAIQGLLSNAILKYFLVLDSTCMELGNIPFLRAADWLFKAYHVFNVHYPLSWRVFFRFLQTCLFKVFVDKNDDVVPSAQNLYAMLLSL